jgi:type III restriction enzyme
LNLIVEIKGYRGEDAKVKKETMQVYWLPSVNALGTHGRWAFVEFADVYPMQDDFRQTMERAFEQMVNFQNNG